MAFCLLVWALFLAHGVAAESPAPANVDGSAARRSGHAPLVNYALIQGLSSGQTFIQTFVGRPTDPPGSAKALDLCTGKGDAQSDDVSARLEPVLCTLPTPQPQTPPTPPTESPGFAYYPPGDLDPNDGNRGRKDDRKIYLPNIIFPLKLAAGQHPHMNSQIWGRGGSGYDGKGAAGGSECDPVNYDPLKQRDTYCETRTWEMPLCPGGTGHQGQDIRPPTCKNNTWEAVAVVAGTITKVTSNTTVQLKGADGTDYFYLHMYPQSIKVKAGAKVKQGDVLGRVSNYMEGKPNGTTTHLHFQVRQTIKVDGKILSVYVPPYSSLIAAYRKDKGLNAGIGTDGNLIVDAQLEIEAPKPPTPSPAPPQENPPPAPPPAPQPQQPTPPPPAPQQPTPPAQPPTPAPTPQQPAPQPPTPQQPTPPAQPPAPAPAPEQPAPQPPPAPQQPTPPAQPPAPAPAPEQPAPSRPPAPIPPSPGPGPQQAPSPGQQPTTTPLPSWLQKALDTAKSWWNNAWR